MALRSGIYQIVNIQTNERYIGSTKNFTSRKASHLWDLRKNLHKCPRLQSAYNHWGENNFKFLILEYVQTIQVHLIEREQYWMDILHPEYNESLIAGKVIPRSAKTKEAITRIGHSIKKLWEDPTYRENFSAKNKGRVSNRKGVTLSEETKQKIREANSGVNNPNYGKPRSQSFMNKMSRTWTGLVDPNGIPQPPITNMAQFCRERGLDNGQMSRLLGGKVKSYKGWTKV